MKRHSDMYSKKKGCGETVNSKSDSSTVNPECKHVQALWLTLCAVSVVGELYECS